MYSQQHYAISHLICPQKWIKSHSQRSSGHNGRLETSFFVVCWCEISGALEHDRLWQYFRNLVSSAVIAFFWRATACLLRGFPLPEERHRAWTSPEAQTAIVFCTEKLVVSRMMSQFQLQQRVFSRRVCCCCSITSFTERAESGRSVESVESNMTQAKLRGLMQTLVL